MLTILSVISISPSGRSIPHSRVSKVIVSAISTDPVPPHNPVNWKDTTKLIGTIIAKTVRATQLLEPNLFNQIQQLYSI
jgi:hypothetical protein